VITALEQLLVSARWFGGKGREFTVSDVRRVGTLGSLTPDGPLVDVRLVTVAYADGGAETYQVPLALYRGPQERLSHALVGSWEDDEHGAVHAYDAVHDREAGALYLRAFAKEATLGELTFHRIPGYELDLEAHSTLLSAEQSNSSMAFGEDSLLKLFRKVTPGVNPDIEIHAALTRAGSDHVAALYGWLELAGRSPGVSTGSTIGSGSTSEETTHLALLQQFLRTASDGWDLALASVRDLIAEADLRADEVGGDFAAEAHRLGEATAEVHSSLAEQFPVRVWSGPDLAKLRDTMKTRLDEATEVVPELEASAKALRKTYDALSHLTEPVKVQRVHGDLHLGQTLRTVKGWKIVDFEGEPAKPLADRTQPDSPWRDVAGMLRSFDYAAHAVRADVDNDENAQAQLEYRALEWAGRNQEAFLAGYLGDTLPTPEERALLNAYEADKAVYEAVYEARNRPTWLPIPLAALARLTGSPH
jgi:maltokinase